MTLVFNKETSLGELVVEYVISSVTKGVKVVEMTLAVSSIGSIGWVNKASWNWWMIWKIIIGIRWLRHRG